MNVLKHKKYFIIVIALLFIFDIFIFKYCEVTNYKITLSFEIQSDKKDIFQVFYSENSDWTGEHEFNFKYNEENKKENVVIEIPGKYNYFRIDLGNQKENIELTNIFISSKFEKIPVDYKRLYEGKNHNNFGNTVNLENGFKFNINVDDPYMTYQITDNERKILNSNVENLNLILKIGLCIFIDIFIILFVIKSKNISILFSDFYHNKRLTLNLSKNDFKTKYSGSYLGIIWAFIQPIVTILVYWLVFEYGLRSSSPMKDVPYVFWFVTGLIPWFFFSEALNNATNSFIEYSYLVKKVKFKISILPMIKVLSAFYIHIIFICFSIFLFICGKHNFTIHILQLFYYCMCLFILVLAMSYATSAIVVFFRDLGQIISIFLQIGMWMTPILWSYTILPDKLLWVMKLNPMFYIIEGYRDSFLNGAWFWEKYFQTIYFWIFTLSIFVLGATIFKKLKPHFSDVL